MGKTTNLNIRIDEELKRDAEAIFHELGLSMSVAMNIFLRHCVRYGGIPFELRIEKPNAETLAAIDDVNNNRNMSKVFDSVSALSVDLDSDEDTIITNSGKPGATIPSANAKRQDMVESLTGILPGSATLEMAREERLRKNDDFDEEILADLIADGLSGERLLNEFIAKRRQIKPAIDALLEEARLAAREKKEASGYDEIFGQDDHKGE